MPKSAIINPAGIGFIERANFKQLALFFDQIYADHMTLAFAKTEIEESLSLEPEQKKFLRSEIDWLLEQGILQSYRMPPMDLKASNLDPILAEHIQKIDEEIQTHFIPVDPDKDRPTTPGKVQFIGSLGAPGHFFEKMRDIRMRIDAAQLSVNYPQTQFIPLVQSFDSYHSSHSTDLACHFILEKIPIPGPDTSWEQLLEFRSDEEVKRKYNALMHWINTISRQDIPVAHLADHYNHLYSEYQRQYSLHRLSSNFTMIESLLLSGIEFIGLIAQQKFVSAFKGLLNFRKEKVTLLQAERNIEGNELAYIFAAEEQFKNR